MKKTLKSKTDKRNLFCDYAATGRTLRTVNALLNHPKVKLGKESDDYVKINEFLINNPDIVNSGHRKIVQKFNRMLRIQRFDWYAEVGTLGFRNLKKIYSVLKPSDIIQNKLMKFCILDLFKTCKSMD